MFRDFLTREYGFNHGDGYTEAPVEGSPAPAKKTSWLNKMKAKVDPYCAASHCAACHCTASHCAASHCAASHCAASHCAAFHCAATHCTASHCTASHCTASHCTASHCTASHCTASHCTASHCTASHCTASHCAASHTVFILLLSLATVWVSCLMSLTRWAELLLRAQVASTPADLKLYEHPSYENQVPQLKQLGDLLQNTLLRVRLSQPLDDVADATAVCAAECDVCGRESYAILQALCDAFIQLATSEESHPSKVRPTHITQNIRITQNLSSSCAYSSFSPALPLALSFLLSSSLAAYLRHLNCTWW